MKALKKIGISLVVLILGVLLISLFFPAEIQVERSIRIDAPGETVFSQINTMKNWEVWKGPWQDKDPAIKINYSGAASGKGAVLHFDSKHPDTGKGSVAIIESDPIEKIRTEISFGDGGKANGNWLFQENNDGTLVTWRLDVNLGWNPIKKIMAGLMMDGMVGPDFEKGLQRLKTVCESE